MKKIKIFEPAMCCSTGLCGVGIDPELMRISTVINSLKRKGIVIERFNLSNAPQAFIDNNVVNVFINQYGTDKLPITLVDEEVRVTGHYPSNEEFADWLELSTDVSGISKQDIKKQDIKADGCCCKGDRC